MYLATWSIELAGLGRRQRAPASIKRSASSASCALPPVQLAAAAERARSATTRSDHCCRSAGGSGLRLFCLEVRERRFEHGRNVQRKLTTALLREWQNIAQREDVVCLLYTSPSPRDS